MPKPLGSIARGLVFFAVAMALLASAIIVWHVLTPSAPPPHFEGPVFEATERTLISGGPVKDDLINRGLFATPASDSDGSPVPGFINYRGIEEAVQAGIYTIGADGALTFGPKYVAPPLKKSENSP